MIVVMDRLTNNSNNERRQLEMLTMDQMVPEDLLVRKLEAAIDLNFIYFSSISESVAFRYGGRFSGHSFSLIVATLLRGLFALAFPAEVAACAPIN
ncbi:hypothetical protein ACMGD3_12850 [Lysinibacillus sphaericus]|uniref:hypothetical protein n=1 Tax=Lysinibacillus sphaericus TaxID=1421 RepID=UPI001C6039A4